MPGEMPFCQNKLKESMLGTWQRLKLIKEMPRLKCGPKGSWTPPSPNCHLVHDPQVKSHFNHLFEPIFGHLRRSAPRTPWTRFARINNFSQAYRLVFVIFQVQTFAVATVVDDGYDQRMASQGLKFWVCQFNFDKPSEPRAVTCARLPIASSLAPLRILK